MEVVERVEFTPDRQTHLRIKVMAPIYVEDINLTTSTLSSCTCSFEG
jgi:hypothetical protein